MTSAKDRVNHLVHTLYEEGYEMREVEQAMRDVDPTEIYLELLEEEFVEEFDNEEEWVVYYGRRRGLFINRSLLDSLHNSAALKAIEEKAAELGYRVNARKLPDESDYRIQVVGRFSDEQENR